MIPNNFTQHGIAHLSASSINAYAEDASFWCAKYLFGAKFPFSSPARGGTLIERAIVQTLTGRDIEDATAEALADFSKETLFDNSDKTQKWAAGMPDMVAMGVKELSGFGIPEFELDGGQKKVLINCDMGDYKMPVIGFLDLLFPDKKIIIDIKCTMRAPSEMSASHKRQAAIYKMANPEFEVMFFYITPKKTQMFYVQDVTEERMQIKETVKRMNAMLGIGDKDVIKSIIPISDSFYWTDAKETRKELYGI